jgi:hypothetical protein
MTLADTHERQTQIWEEAKAQWCGRIPVPQTLRKMVTDDKMAISHPMFEFVGEEAYTAAGGILTADLFSDRDSTFADAALVKSVLAGKLTVLAARLKQEQGWGWAEFRMTKLNSKGEDRELYRFAMPEPVLTEEEQKRISELEEKSQRLTTTMTNTSFSNRLTTFTARRLTAKPHRNFAPHTVSGCHGTLTIFRSAGYSQAHRRRPDGRGTGPSGARK